LLFYYNSYYANRVTADFVSKFVAMTNRLLLQTHKIDYTSLDSLSLRTPC